MLSSSKQMVICVFWLVPQALKCSKKINRKTGIWSRDSNKYVEVNNECID